MREERHFELSGEVFRLHDQGAYGDLFVNPNRKTCWKVFRNGDQPCQRRRTFESEVEAYELATAHSELKRYIPDFLGILKTPLRIFDAIGRDVSDGYLTMLAYKMTFIEGRFRKVGAFKPKYHAVMVEQFRAAGIVYLTDASWTTGPLGEPCYIDFAAKEHAL